MNPEAIATFCAVTGAADHVADHVLEAHGGNLDAAISFYLESGGIGHGHEVSPGHRHLGPDGPRPARAAPRSVPVEASYTLFLFSRISKKKGA
jgi:hypothetical protein